MSSKQNINKQEKIQSQYKIFNNKFKIEHKNK